MPKREATPPPGDESVKFFTIHYPYPQNADIELLKDRKECAFWLACILEGETDKLYRLYFRPRTPNMIVIEVAKSFERFDRLLGEHRAAEYLRAPTAEYKNHVSRIYYCTLSNTRQVEKAGWKNIDVTDDWFKCFNKQNKIVKYPYPRPVWCDVPTEDKTNYPLCRPIPQTVLPPPAPAPAPRAVPGSAVWVNDKTSGTSFSKVLAAPPAQAKQNAQSQPPCEAAPMVNPGLSTASSGSLPSSRCSTPQSDTHVPANVTKNPYIGLQRAPSQEDLADLGGVPVAALGALDIKDGQRQDDLGFSGGYLGDFYDPNAYLSPQQSVEPEKPLCNSHGVKCKPGICMDYKRQLKKWEEDLAKAKGLPAANQKPSRQDGWNTIGTARGRGSGRGNAFDNGNSRDTQVNSSDAWHFEGPRRHWR